MTETCEHMRAFLDALKQMPELATKQASLWYAAGGLAAMRKYAWWKDGQEYVGCGARTLAHAEREWLDEIKQAIKPTTEESDNG